MKNWNAYENLCNRFNTNLGKRIIRKNHRGRRVEKTYNMMSNISRWGIYIGEVAIVLLLSCVSFLFGKGEGITENSRLVYPLYEVSLLSCRTMQWDTMPDTCKIKLPIIHGANFDAYKDNKTYTDIYTTHWGASYTSGWDNMVGTHYGTDIATAPGTPLYAIADGVVYSSVYNSAYGNVVKIKFKYQGEILYAVYAHMSERLVEAGDEVKAGDLIGKTGNSGNVFGALGGYHVHFEIDKDTNGRPAWVFSTCPTISKGDYAVIQAGECRMQLFQYTKDPIVLLEKANAQYPNPTAEKIEKEEKSEGTHGTTEKEILTGTSVSTGEINTGKEIIVTPSEKENQPSSLEKTEKTENTEKTEKTEPQLEKQEKPSQPTEENPSKSEENLQNETEKPSSEEQKQNTPSEEKKESQTTEPSNSSKEQTSQEKTSDSSSSSGNSSGNSSSDSNSSPSANTEPEKSGNAEKTSQPTENEEEIKLDFSEVDYYGKLFVEQYEIKIVKSFEESIDLSQGEQTFTISLTDKRTQEKFHGTISQPFVFVASNTTIDVSPSSTVLFNKGIATVKITPKKAGNSYVVIMLGNKRIGGVAVSVQ